MAVRSKRLEHLIQKIYRMRQVGAYMDAHLHEPLCLDDLSDIACLSRYQFSREFAAYTGETPISRIWRLRLKQAYETLRNGQCSSILELALTTGFNSSEAFSRAFSKAYGIAPSHVLPLQNPKMTEIRVVQLPEIAIQSLSYGGLASESHFIHDEVRALAIQAGVAKQKRKGCMIYSNPELFSENHNPASQIELKSGLISHLLGTRIPGFESSYIPAGDYAVIEFSGLYRHPTNALLATAIEQKTGRILTEGLRFRRAHNVSYVPAKIEFRFELYWPVEPI